jgi:elongation factor Ts
MTGVGMMDCKKALVETNGDMEKAVEFLREKGLAAAQKKAGRIAAEGVVYAYVNDAGVGAVLEVNSETDFVAKNEDFQKFVKELTSVVANGNPADVAEMLTKAYPDSNMTVEKMLQEKVLVIGENIQIRRFERYDTGTSVAYVHMGGKIGVLVNMDISDNLKGNETVNEIGKDVAMQIAAMRPMYLDRASVPSSNIDKEKEILMAQAMEEGKPQNVAEKVVAGRINKYYEEFCLVDQPFVKENKITVAKYVEQKAKELGGTIKINKFVRFEKGEGIEKKKDDFAEEVAKMAK